MKPVRSQERKANGAVSTILNHGCLEVIATAGFVSVGLRINPTRRVQMEIYDVIIYVDI